MTITRNTIPAALVPGLMDIMFDEYEMYPVLHPQILNMGTSERMYEEWVGYAGVGPAEVKGEGIGVSYVDIQQLTPKRVTNIAWALAMRCTREAMDDDLYGVLTRKATALGKAFPIRKEVEALNIINCGFITAFATGQDGLALFSNAHPIKQAVWSQVAGSYPDSTAVTGRLEKIGPLTGSNLLAAADLSYLTLTDMVQLARYTVDEVGNFITIPPKFLWHSPANERLVKELLQSDRRPDSADNAINAWKGDLMPISSPYFVDQDAWGLIADKSNHDLRFFQRIPFETEEGSDFDTGDTKIKGYERYGIGFADWRGVWGCVGA